MNPEQLSRELADDRLRAQFVLSEVLGSASTLDEAAPRLLDALAPCLGAEASELWLVDPTSSELACVASRAEDAEALARFAGAARTMRLGAGVGLPGKVLESGHPAWVADVTADRSFARPELARRADLHAAIAFPIRFAGRTLGVIQFFRRVPEAPNEALLAVFRDIGTQLGLFIERLRMDDVIVSQAREIVELSAPVLRLWDGVVALPIVGVLDQRRADRLLERALEGVVETRAAIVLLDLTAVPFVDTHTARHVGDVVRAIQLLGAKVALTGVAPRIAMTLAKLGVDMSSVEARGTLADGLRFAIAASAR